MIAHGGTPQIDIKQLMKSINVLTILGVLYSYESIIQPSSFILSKNLDFWTFFLLEMGAIKLFEKES